MTRHVVAINNISPRSSSRPKNPYAFCHDLIGMLRGPSITFRISTEQNIGTQEKTSFVFHVEVAPQNVQKMIDVLAQAEELQKEMKIAANTDLLEKLDQTNKEISAWISQELPTMVLLAFIEKYYQEHAKAFAQMEQQRREHIRRGENIAVSCLLIGSVFMAVIGILFVLSYQNQILFLLLLILGPCLELAGISCLRVNAARRRKISNILQRRFSLHQFRMMPLMIGEIADQQKKQAMMQELLMSLLNGELRAKPS